ncbi:MAG: ABC transporter permease [Schwartzia sp. (in: firmicutes)]
MMKRKVDFPKVLCGVFLLILAVLILISLFAAEIAPHDPLKIQHDLALQGPSAAFPFGTDDFGRCVFSRILYGMRSSLFMSLLIVGISLAIGTTAGIVSGYFGGRVDDCIMRLTDMFLAFPGMVFSIAVVGVLGVGWGNTAIALILPGWLIFARLSRGLVLTVKEKEYLRSAKAAGLTTFQIMRRYILPNIAQQLVIVAAIEIGSTLISFCALTYLGMGAQPPEPELGLMLSEAKSKMQIAPWMMFFPCLTVFVIVILFQLLSDALRDVLDPSRSEGGQ